MPTIVLLLISAVLQVAGAVLALRLIRATGLRWAWLTIAAAMLLMAIDHGMTAASVWSGRPLTPLGSAAAWLSLVIAVLLVVGFAGLPSVLACLRALGRNGAGGVSDLERDLFRSGPVVAFRCGAADSWPVECVSSNVGQLGYAPDDFAGGRLPFAAIIVPDDRGRVVEEVREFGEAGAPVFEQEFRIRRPGGEQRWVSAFTRVIRDRLGRITHFERYLQDITERKRAEEQRVSHERRLRQDQKMEAVGRMAAHIAHDFNNFLTAILGYADLAKRHLLPDDKAGAEIDGIVQVAERAGGVMHSLSTFSREGSSRRSPVLWDRLIADAVAMVRPSLPSNIEVVVESSPEAHVWVEAAADQVQQVVANLATNARDAMPEGGRLRITVDYRPTAAADLLNPGAPADQGIAELVMEDTGSGMPPEVLERVFEPFFTTKTRGRGVGMGLPVVHGIVSDHLGVVDIQSAVGQGTAVTVRLPCCRCPDDAAVCTAEAAVHGA